MGKKIAVLSEKTIEYSFYLLFFLIPLALTPFNYELFEFNKMMLVYLLMTIIVAAWLAKMILQEKIIFRRTFMDFPFLLFFVSQLFATILSIDRHTSLWGYYSRFHGGLFSTISYLLLYWAYVSNMNKKKGLRSVGYLLLSGLLVTLYGIAEHFGIDAQYWVQDVRNRVFSTLGQPNWLAAWLVAIIPLTWHASIRQKNFLSLDRKKVNLLGFILASIFYLCLLYTKSRSGLIGFGAAYLVFWGLFYLVSSKRLPLKPLVTLTTIIFLLTVLVGTPWTPSLKDLGLKVRKTETVEEEQPITPVTQPLITESSEIRQIVWRGAIDLWRNYPAFGTGVETFAYSYYWHRPREHNDVSEWDFLYNKAHNEFLNLAATTGTFGLLTYLAIIGSFIFWGLKQLFIVKRKTKDAFIIALLAGFATIPITNFFGFSVVAVAFLFFLFPAVGFVFIEGKEKEEKVKIQALNTKQSASLALVSVAALLILARLILFWYADFLFAKGKKLGEAGWHQQAYQALQMATDLCPGEPFFHDEFALAAANLAVAAHQQKEATLSAQLSEIAVIESGKALETSPYHLNFWKGRTRIFYKLAEIDEEYNQLALESLLQAAELAPTDAKIHYNLGLLYARVGEEEKATETMEKTVELKPNYADARYALALFYEKEGKIKEAREQLEYILEKIDPNYETAQEKLKTL